MASLKLTYEGEHRRMGIASISYQDVLDLAKRLFFVESSINLTWTDKDGDDILCSSSDEFQEAVKLMHPELVFVVKSFEGGNLHHAQCSEPIFTSSIPFQRLEISGHKSQRGRTRGYRYAYDQVVNPNRCQKQPKRHMKKAVKASRMRRKSQLTSSERPQKLPRMKENVKKTIFKKIHERLSPAATFRNEGGDEIGISVLSDENIGDVVDRSKEIDWTESMIPGKRKLVTSGHWEVYLATKIGFGLVIKCNNEVVGFIGSADIAGLDRYGRPQHWHCDVEHSSIIRDFLLLDIYPLHDEEEVAGAALAPVLDHVVAFLEDTKSLCGVAVITNDNLEEGTRTFVQLADMEESMPFRVKWTGWHKMFFRQFPC